MALKDLLDLSASRRKVGLSEERLRGIIPEARKYIAFWREYPDLFIDFMAGPDGGPQHFHFFFLFYCWSEQISVW